MSRSKYPASFSSSFSEHSSIVAISIPAFARAGRSSLLQSVPAGRELPDRSRIASSASPRREAVDGPDGQLRLVELEQPGDPHHEEVVEVLREDRHEPHPLEERQALLLGKLEDARV